MNNQSRTIKFRIWNDKENHFGYLHIGCNKITWPTANYMTYEISEGFDGVKFKYVTKPWQQFSGFKDQNKIEIYEGDILNEGWICTFFAGSFRLVKDIYTIKLIGGDGLVIGNIYENPELITVTA